MSQPDICLMMIVKNESAVIKRCLESALPIISRWLIIDTGSTDGTQQIIAETLADLPGELIESTWKDFGTNRTELMAAMPSECDFGLLLDADMIVDIEESNWSDIPDVDCLMIKVAGEMEYRMPYLVRQGPSYRFVGVTHEYLDADQPISRANFDGITIHHMADGGSRSDKFERDKRLLQEDLKVNPFNPRTHFYLGQTLKDLGEVESAIHHYQESARISPWDEERYVSLFRAGNLLREVGDTNAALVSYCRAIEQMPKRYEAYYFAGNLLNDVKLFHSATRFLEVCLVLKPSACILFVERWIEEWGLELEYGVSLWWCGRKEEARAIFSRLVQRGDLPPHAHETALRNLSYTD